MKLIILATISLFITISFSWWSINRIYLIKTWSIGSYLVAISPDGKLLATPDGPFQEFKIGNTPVGGKTTLKLYSFPDEKLVRTIDAFAVSKIAFSPDNSLIAAGNGLGEIFIWAIDNGQLLHSLKSSSKEPISNSGMLRTNTLIFSRDGQMLVSGVGGQIDVWRVSDGQLLYNISREHLCHGDISPDGQILVIGGTVDKITLYRLSDGTGLRQLDLYGDPKFSADGRLLAISYSHSYNAWGKVLIYRLEDNTFLGTLAGLEKNPIDLAFSPDGRYLAATYKTGGYVGSVLVRFVPQKMSKFNTESVKRARF